MKKSSFFNDTVWITASRAVTILFKFFLDVIIANEAGRELYGKFSYFLLIILTLSTFLSFGVQNANNYFVSSGALAIERVKRINIHFLLSVSLLGLIVFVLYNFHFDRTLTDYIRDRRIILLGGAGFSLIVLNNVTVSLLQSLKKIRAYSVVFLLNAVLLCLAFGTVFRFVRVSMHNFVIVYVAALLLADLAGLAVLKIHAPGRSLRTAPEQYRMFFNYGFKTYLCSVAIFFLPRIDMFFVNSMLPVENVGYYRIALNVAEKIIFITIALAALLKPTLPAMQADESAGFIKKISRINLLMIIVFAGIFFLGSGLLMQIYNPEYLPALPPLRLLLAASVFLSMNTILDEFFLGRKKPGLNGISYLAGFVFKLSVSYFMIRRWGISGAAVSTLAAYIVILVTKLILLRHDLSFRDLVILKKEDLLYVLRQIRIQ